MTPRTAGKRLRKLGGSDLLRTVAANFSARLLAILGLSLATILVARLGGPAAVGSYALMRMLPGLVGVLAVAGLPGAQAYFLSGPRRTAPRLWPTLMAILAVGSALGTAAWLLGATVLQSTFFPRDSVLVVAAGGLTVATQLFLTVGKTALQGLEDRRGGDVVIAAEEIAFLPCYAVPLLLGWHGTAAVVVALALADLTVGVYAWHRVSRRAGWRRWGLAGDGHGWLGRPDRKLAREVVAYGLRGQLGGVITLLNLRLDFAILGAMAGPAVLGTYAVASKYAEILRLPGTALTWVCYPRLAGVSHDEAARRAWRMLRPALLGVAAAAVPMALLTAPVIGLLYGARFSAADGPARVLLLGMLVGGGAGVASGYLYARGRPGSNSVATGIGLVFTVALDLLLIPRYAATGAAWASAVAYLLTDLTLVVMLLRATRTRSAAPTPVSRPGAVEISP
ncbi:MAG: lipopolysaccharide biosynthesis protein [Nocardioidaceae bacterium]